MIGIKCSKETLYFLGSLVDTQKTFIQLQFQMNTIYFLPDPLIMYNPPANVELKYVLKHVDLIHTIL